MDTVLVQEKSDWDEHSRMILIPKTVAETYGLSHMDRLDEDKFNEVMQASCMYGINLCNAMLERNN